PALIPAHHVQQTAVLPHGTHVSIPHTAPPPAPVPPPVTPPISRESLDSADRVAGFRGPTSGPSDIPGVDFGPTERAPLGWICAARSGDKGGNANVGLWTRTAAEYDWLRAHLTVPKLRELLPEAADLAVHRYE